MSLLDVLGDELSGSAIGCLIVFALFFVLPVVLLTLAGIWWLA